jgi:hypothetical protein
VGAVPVFVAVAVKVAGAPAQKVVEAAANDIEGVAGVLTDNTAGVEYIVPQPLMAAHRY